MHQDARGPLDQGLDDHRGDLRGMLLEDSLHFQEAVHGAGTGGLTQGTPVAERGRGPVGGEEQLPVHGMKQVDSPYAHRANRIAVVGIGQTDVPGFRRVSPGALLVVLEGHFQGDLDGGRTAVRIKDPGQARGSDLDELFGQLDGGDVGQSQEGGVSDLVHLVL